MRFSELEMYQWFRFKGMDIEKGFPYLRNPVGYSRSTDNADIMIDKNSDKEVEVNTKIKCPCCGHLTIEEEWDICPVCFWENDPIMSQEDWLDIPIGANHVSLNEAKDNYLLFGACERQVLEYVRKPFESEKYNGTK